jgi:hypothetical protein
VKTFIALLKVRPAVGDWPGHCVLDNCTKGYDAEAGDEHEEERFSHSSFSGIRLQGRNPLCVVTALGWLRFLRSGEHRSFPASG